jgi:hypothetical protein
MGHQKAFKITLTGRTRPSEGLKRAFKMHVKGLLKGFLKDLEEA